MKKNILHKLFILFLLSGVAITTPSPTEQHSPTPLPQWLAATKGFINTAIDKSNEKVQDFSSRDSNVYFVAGCLATGVAFYTAQTVRRWILKKQFEDNTENIGSCLNLVKNKNYMDILKKLEILEKKYACKWYHPTYYTHWILFSRHKILSLIDSLKTELKNTGNQKRITDQLRELRGLLPLQ